MTDNFEETDTCPEHGEQAVTSYSSTPGPDPYGVQHLACGHRVVCYGPGEENYIYGGVRADYP